MLHEEHLVRTHMLMRHKPPAEGAIEGCIACIGIRVTYGKYFSEDGDDLDNSFFLFKDPAHKKGDGPLPIIIHFHSGGFFMGSAWRRENAEIKEYLRKGFAVVSVGYRLVTQKYLYFGEESNKTLTEELIHVGEDGALSLDESGKTMDDYKVRVGKQEFITKFLYDATQMMESIIDNSDKFGLDPHRIVFISESTGGAAIQYLTWVYHKMNVGRFTPRGMVLTNAQLNYPVNNMLGETWDIFAETLGPDVKLSDVVSQEACPTVIGNHMCGSTLGEASDYDLCNETWNKISLEKFCGDALWSATLADVNSSQRWPREDDEVGLEKLWHTSKMMAKHLPTQPFYIYVANSMNGTSYSDVAHHSVYAMNFAKFAELGQGSGIDYTVYYTDFARMTKADHGMMRLNVVDTNNTLGSASRFAFPVGALANADANADSVEGPSLMLAPAPAPMVAGPSPAPAPAPGPIPALAPSLVGESVVFNYLSTHQWRETSVGNDVEPGSLEEQVLYACLAAGLEPFPGVISNATLTSTPEPKSDEHQPKMLGLYVLLGFSILLACYGLFA